MKSLKGTETAVNLMKSFAGESQARMRYTYYASVADKEGYKQIRTFSLKQPIMRKSTQRGSLNFSSQVLMVIYLRTLKSRPDFVAQGNTLDNLKYAAHGENEEWTSISPICRCCRQRRVP